MREDEDRPRKMVAPQIGERLDDLSVAELDTRIALLRDEIVRLENAKTLKQSARLQAGSFFKT